MIKIPKFSALLIPSYFFGIFEDMEKYEDHINLKDSIVKNSLYGLCNSQNKKQNETDHCVSPMSFSNISFGKQNTDRNIFSEEKGVSKFDAFIMPNDLYLSFNTDASKSSKMLSKNDKLESPPLGHCSTPASPEEMERTRNKLAKRDISSFHSPVSEKKIAFSYTTGFVRTSKSEDHLQKSSMTTVNIDIEDEMASSLNTLLDTKHDNAFCDFEEKGDLSSSYPTVNFERATSPEISQPNDSPKSEFSPTSSETSSPSKISMRLIEFASEDKQTSDRQSESSGSEIIPSDSSTTIRRDDSECSEGECTSEQISAISSLEDADPSHATDSGDSPTDSLSPAVEFPQEEEDWFGEFCKRETVTDSISDILKNKIINKSKQMSPNVQLNFTNGIAEGSTLQGSNGERNMTSQCNSLSVLKMDADTEKGELSIDSPTSFCSEDTFGDVSYHELTESYDEESMAEMEEESKRSESPPTDDESDIESLHSFHYSPKAVDLPSASRLAKRLYNLDGFKKTDVSRHLSKNNEFSRAVAEEYLKYFDFTSDSLDLALRKFLNHFCLIGETQERERVLVHFSKHYLDCNPGCFRSQDAVHTLTCALMLLNSDLHGESVCRRMVCGEFVENLSELNDGENFPREILKSLYHSIKSQPLEWAIDNEDEKKGSSNGHASSENRHGYIGHNPFLEVPNPNCATEYKKGYVMRKCCIDPSGKKTALGRRGWKMLYATLRDLVLYLHKDEHGFKKNQLYDSLHNSIRIHHAFATKAVDYTKKQYVFRLHTADQAVYLFQTSDSKELDSWVDTINLVAASLSTSPLASAVGCQRKFQRPLLPVSHTKLNLREQLQDHENRIVWLEKEQEEHLSRAPEKGAKSRFLQEYTEKETHLQTELTRYRTYAFLLRSKMSQYPELETSLVQTSIGEVEEPVEKYISTDSPSSSPGSTKSLRTLVTSSEISADSNNGPGRTFESDNCT